MLIGMFMPSRTVAIEYPLRNTVPPFPKLHESTGAFSSGTAHANPSEGEKLFQLALYVYCPGFAAVNSGVTPVNTPGLKRFPTPEIPQTPSPTRAYVPLTL